MKTMKRLCAGLIGLLLPLPLHADPEVKILPGPQEAKAAPGTPAEVKVSSGPLALTVTAPAPVVSIILGDRHGHVVPTRHGFQHTAGGNIDVAQPSPDVVVITMSGVAVAGAHACKKSAAAMDFDLDECFEVFLDNPQARNVKLSLDARVVGLLRSHSKHGVADESGCATISCGPAVLASAALPGHAVSCGQNLSINDLVGPVTLPIHPGRYTLHETFHVGVEHAQNLFPCKAASAEFAPDPALDPIWISYFEPFHGANKKDFGFKVTLKVSAE